MATDEAPREGATKAKSAASKDEADPYEGLPRGCYCMNLTPRNMMIAHVVMVAAGQCGLLSSIPWRMLAQFTLRGQQRRFCPLCGRQFDTKEFVWTEIDFKMFEDLEWFSRKPTIGDLYEGLPSELLDEAHERFLPREVARLRAHAEANARKSAGIEKTSGKSSTGPE